MEETDINPISGEQLPTQDLDLEPAVLPGRSDNDKIVEQNAPVIIQKKESQIEKRMTTLKRSIFILGAVLVLVLIVLVLVLAIIAKQNGSDPAVVVTPSPEPSAIATPSEKIPKEILDKVKETEEKVKKLDIEENKLSFPSLDWEIKY